MNTKREIMKLAEVNEVHNSGMLMMKMLRIYTRKKPIKYSTMTLALELVRKTSMVPWLIQSTRRMKMRWVRVCWETLT